MQFLGPFVRGEGYEVTDAMGNRRRTFVQELERNLHLTLNWRHGERSAAKSLLDQCAANPSLLVDVVDYALRNILLGSYHQNSATIADDLERALLESGAAWRVGRIEGTPNYRLERRTDPAASAALARLTDEETREGAHLSAAWDAAYGRNPNPTTAYSEAIKAVEESAIPIVLPNDPKATLGKVIAALRDAPGKWDCIFDRDSRVSTGATVTPVDVVVAMLDLLWTNQTDRHAPIEPISQAQAESAVQLALALVGIFRSEAISRQ